MKLTKIERLIFLAGFFSGGALFCGIMAALEAFGFRFRKARPSVWRAK